jgi:hypothetical protein
LVFLASFLAAAYLPLPEVFRGLAAVPGIGAMIGVLLQIERDQRAHERALDLQARSHGFTLAVASHMAQVAFDKHVSFCEDYLSATTDGLLKLFSSGPNEEAIKLSAQLVQLRLKYIAWLSPQVEDGLIGFESALRKIGATSGYLKSVPVGETRSTLVEQMYKQYEQVLTIDKADKGEQANIAAAHVVAHLRNLLGIEALTSLRQEALAAARAQLSHEEAV